MKVTKTDILSSVDYRRYLYLDSARTLGLYRNNQFGVKNDVTITNFDCIFFFQLSQPREIFKLHRIHNGLSVIFVVDNDRNESQNVPPWLDVQLPAS